MSRVCSSYLLYSRTHPLHRASKLIQGGICALEQAVDDINHGLPVALDGIKVLESWRTYYLRICRRTAEKPLRKTHKTRILAVY